MSKHSAPAEAQLRAWRKQLQELARQAALCVELSGCSRPDSAVVGPVGGVLAGRVLADLERLLRVQPAAKGHQLMVRPPAVPVALQAPAADLLRILVNLGRNALECSAVPHRVDIESWLVHEPVHFGAPERAQGRFVVRDTFQNQPPWLAIAVKDDGPGVSPEIWPHLFHTAVTTKPGHGEVGLGLSVVRDLVLANAGALELRAVPGEDTTVTLYIPARRVPDAA